MTKTIKSKILAAKNRRRRVTALREGDKDADSFTSFGRIWQHEDGMGMDIQFDDGEPLRLRIPSEESK